MLLKCINNDSLTSFCKWSQFITIFTAVHSMIKSTVGKDIMMIAHVAYGGIVFIPIAFSSLIGWNGGLASSFNQFFMGTIIPVMVSWIITARYKSRIKVSAYFTILIVKCYPILILQN